VSLIKFGGGRSGRHWTALESIARNANVQARIAAEQLEVVEELARASNAGSVSLRSALEGISVTLDQRFTELNALFDTRMGTVIGLLEQGRRIQERILDVLEQPMATIAEEQKRWAREAYYKALVSSGDADRQRHYFEDALHALEEAARHNRQDHTVHLNHGRILLLHLDRPGDALSYLKLAVHHAAYTAPGDEAEAWFWMAHAHRRTGDPKAAYHAASRALALEPETLVFAYELARCCVLAGRAAECVPLLERALRVEFLGGRVSEDEATLWWAKICAEVDFEGGRNEIDALWERLTAESAEALREAQRALEDVLRQFSEALTAFGEVVDAPVLRDEVEAWRNRPRDLPATRGNYLEQVEMARRLARERSRLDALQASELDRALYTATTNHHARLIRLRGQLRDQVGRAQRWRSRARTVAAVSRRVMAGWRYPLASAGVSLVLAFGLASVSPVDAWVGWGVALAAMHAVAALLLVAGTLSDRALSRAVDPVEARVGALVASLEGDFQSWRTDFEQLRMARAASA